PGQLGGLRGADLLDRGARVPVVLARDHHDPGLPGDLQVAAAHGLHPVLGESVAEPAAADLARARGGLSLLGGGHPDDPLRDAGGAARGLRAHRARQGADAAPHPGPPRAQERDAAGPDRDRPGVRVPHRRPRGDRAGVQPERDRAPLRAGGGPPRLHPDPGPGDAGGRHLHLRELRHGRHVRLARPSHPLPVKNDAKPPNKGRRSRRPYEQIKTMALPRKPDPTYIQRVACPPERTRRPTTARNGRHGHHPTRERQTRRTSSVSHVLPSARTGQPPGETANMAITQPIDQTATANEPTATTAAWAAIRDFGRRHTLGAIGAVVVLIMIVVGVFANVLSPYDPVAVDLGAMLAKPNAAHWLGTDAFGRAVLGVGSAYFGGRVDLYLQRLMDIFLSFPLIILALALVAILGNSIPNVIMAITIPMIPRAALVIRSSA